jgi:hypothetical protein
VKLCSTLHAAAFFGLMPGASEPPDSDGGVDDVAPSDGGCSAGGQPSLVLVFASLLLARSRRIKGR